MGLGGSCSMYIGYLFKVILRSFGAKFAYMSKRAGHRAKRNQIWDSGVVAQHTWGTFDHLVVKIILGHFDAPVSKWPVTRTWRTVEQNAVKLGLRDSCNMYMDTFELSVILGSVGALVSILPVTRKRLDLERNGVKFGTRSNRNMYISFWYIGPFSFKIVLEVIQCSCLKMFCIWKTAGHRAKD